MSNYTKSTNFATKDNLTPGDPLKVVRGTEIDTEYNNIATAIATKTDNSAAAITGGSITGITDLAVADGGTGASTATAALNNLLPSQTSNANKYLQTDGTNATWDAVSLSTADITGTLAVANGGTGVTSSTGTVAVVLSNSPTLVTPALGTPSSAVLTNATGLPISTGVSGLGTGVATFLGTPSSANLISAVTDETGTGSLVFANSPTLVTPALGTPSALVGTNITGTASGLTAGNVTTNANLTGAVTSVGNATSLGSFSSANLLGALTDETGTGSAVFATSPTLVTPILGTPTSATLTNATGLPIATGVSGLGTGVATFLATPSSANLAAALTDETGSGANVFATSPTLVTPILGTPTSATLTNATGLPLTTGVTGTLPTANGGTNLTSFTSGGVVYASSSSALATGSALQFNGTELGVGVTPIVGTPIAIQAGTGNTALRLVGTSSSGTSNAGIYWYDSNNTTFNGYIGNFSTGFDFYNQRNTPIVFYTNAAEQMRLTSTGLGIGTSSPSNILDVASSNGTNYAASSASLSTPAGGSNAYLTNTANGGFATLKFQSTNSSSAIGYFGFYNTSGSFTGDFVWGQRTGSTSYAEQMRITSGGNLLVAKTSANAGVAGGEIRATGVGVLTSSGDLQLICNRLASDGDLVEFRQDNTAEGTISVSGTTVSYNGGHLSRYAQTITAKDDSIVKGTVLSNLDEMNVYTKDGQPVDNEQLNKVKVSDTEGDANVAGVFVNWSHDEDHNVDEINMAMTGDMIIRIAQGTTVVRGDLLMSAGDGTAKPQGDDIVRSKTVAKVTSNHITCTYADGSYCVPCVLMAC